MSKTASKKVSFKMPKGAGPAAGVEGEASAIAPHRANADREASTAGVDEWVRHVEPANSAALEPAGAALPPAAAPDRITIDLTAERTWPELVALICVLPCMAVWLWMLNAQDRWRVALWSR